MLNYLCKYGMQINLIGKFLFLLSSSISSMFIFLVSIYTKSNPSQSLILIKFD